MVLLALLLSECPIFLGPVFASAVCSSSARLMYMLTNPLSFMLAMYGAALLSRQVAAFFLNLLLCFDAIPIEVSLVSILCGPGSD